MISVMYAILLIAYCLHFVSVVHHLQLADNNTNPLCESIFPVCQSSECLHEFIRYRVMLKYFTVLKEIKIFL
jgi:hypothetical protein